MQQGFDEDWAHRTIDELTSRGVEFAPGLSANDLVDIGEHIGAAVPHELAMFLSAGVPVSARWANWHEGAEAVAADARQWLEGAFRFDIEHGQYWNPLFGERPASVPAACDRALAFLADAPPLIPVYGHRFLATEPVDSARAVLSVWQAVDSVFYGFDLADYFANEFGTTRPSWVPTEPPRVPVWEELFGLFGNA